MSRRLRALLAVWAVIVVAGSLCLVDYSTRPGAAASIAPSWPQDSQLEPPLATPRLVMFLHPYCPCSRASVRELARVLPRTTTQPHVTVALLQLESEPPEWSRTDLWSAAAAIPGVEVVADPGGSEAVRFGATTSGQVFLFDGNGATRFSGGITAGRGHEGDNPGKTALLALLAASPVDSTVSSLATAAVFGCELLSPADLQERAVLR